MRAKELCDAATPESLRPLRRLKTLKRLKALKD